MKEDTKLQLSFFLTGIMYMLLIVGIRFLNQQPITAITVIASGFFGGLLGAVMVNKESKGWFRNIFVVAAIIFLVYNLLNPVTTVGNTSVVKNAELWTIVGIGLILVEGATIRAIQKLFHKNPKFFLGPFALLGIVLVFNNVFGGVWEYLFLNYWYIFLAIILSWMIIMYLIAAKNIGKVGPAILKRLR